MLQTKFPRELTKNKLLAGVDEAIISAIYDAREVKQKREGEIIYRTGEDSTGIFLLLRGEVRVKYSSNNYVSKKQANDFFGEKQSITRSIGGGSRIRTHGPFRDWGFWRSPCCGGLYRNGHYWGNNSAFAGFFCSTKRPSRSARRQSPRRSGS